MIDYGEVAYNAYVARAGGVSLVSGDPLPSWQDQTEAVRACWREAAEAVILKFNGTPQ